MNIGQLFIIITLFTYHISAQNFSDLRNNYVKSRIDDNSNLVQLTRDKKSWRWLSLLPSVSVSSTWDPFTQVYRPMVNFGISLSNLSTYMQVSNRNRIEREKLAISLQDQLNSDINSIDAELLDIQRDSIALVYDM